MEGPRIVARSLSHPGVRDAYGNLWQYHSQSDRHSKIACWAVLFEMLQHSARLRKHVEAGRVVFGVNQEMRDYRTNRTKDLDLVIAVPTAKPEGTPLTLADLAERWGVELSPTQEQALGALPAIVEGDASMVLVALEAKATMTAHIKALPRLFDELNSSHATIHANSEGTLAAAFAMVNIGATFVSPPKNRRDLSGTEPEVSVHQQPHWATRTVAKLKELPRRTSKSQEGFDALGIVIVDMANDGTAVKVVETPPAPAPGDVFHYDQMITRLVHLYDTSYGGLD